MSQEIDRQALLSAARAARERAFAPYSRFLVGAAVLADDGKIHAGCNVEISSYSLTCCAERVAVFKAVSEGARRIHAVAVVTELEPPAAPCGACRQVLWDLGPEAIVLMAGPETWRETTLKALYPEGFSPERLLDRK